MNSGPLLPALTVSVIVHASVAGWQPPGPTTEDSLEQVLATTIHAEIMVDTIDAGITSESTVPEAVNTAASPSRADIADPIAPTHLDAKAIRTADRPTDFDLITVADPHLEDEDFEKNTIPPENLTRSFDLIRPEQSVPPLSSSHQVPNAGNVRTALLTDERSGARRVVGPPHSPEQTQKTAAVTNASPPRSAPKPSTHRPMAAALQREPGTEPESNRSKEADTQSPLETTTAPASRTTPLPVSVAKNAPVPSMEDSGNDARNLSPQPVSGNPKPRYPRAAVRRGYEGTVELRVAVNSSGAVDQIRIVKGSGYKILDRAAVKAVRRWQFDPAHSLGQPVASETDVPVQFLLVEATRP